MKGVTYYNEWDPYAAQWLRNLMAAGHISEGIVDERSIKDVQSGDIPSRAHFFAGIAGWEYALQLAGWPSDRPVWTGSCPCQPFSAAGKRGGNLDARHLWPDFYALVRECEPSIIFGEQVASQDGRKWLSDIRLDLEAMGYAVGAADLCAASIGAPHIRQRLFWVAHLNGQGFEDHERQQGPPRQEGRAIASNAPPVDGGHRWLPESQDGWRVHGVSAKVGAVRAYGNAIVPQVAAEFIAAFMDIEAIKEPNETR
jgi:DNA (cytosine-5)-methyltransferase 1